MTTSLPSPPSSVGDGPLTSGSVSLRLYPHSLSPTETTAELVEQARIAEAAGFDGVMTSEHHAGFPNYLPTPLLAATWALAVTERIWAAPAPILLPLKVPAHVVEDLAWTAARFPNRIGVGFASGALEDDFDLSEVAHADRNRIFREKVPATLDALAGRASGLLARDPAVAALRERPVPAVLASQGPKSGARAGRLGAGVLLDSIVSIERAAEVAAANREAGGDRQVLIRRVWIGEPPTAEVDRQMERYRAASNAGTVGHWAPDGGLVADTDPIAVAEEIAAQLRASGCDVLNLRIFHAGLEPQACRAQIEAVGADVLPRLRALLPSPATASIGTER